MTRTAGFGIRGGAAIILALCAGSSMAGTIVVTNVSFPLYNLVNIVDTAQSVLEDGNDLPAGTIGLQTSIGDLDSYCVDLYDYINTGIQNYVFNQNVLTAGSSYVNGTATGIFTQNQISILTRLLANGAIPAAQNPIDAAALQVAIWDIEYDTATANGTYNLTSGGTGSFYFTPSSDDPDSAAVLAQAQAFLNNATGYQNGSVWVSATWLADSNQFVEYLTSDPSGTQNLIYLATPEPSTTALFGLGVGALFSIRRRKLI